MGQTDERPATPRAADSDAQAPRKKDIHGATFSDIDWSDRRASIETVLEEVRTKATDAEAWYREKKKNKATGAVVLRLMAIISGILSGVWPILFNALAVMFPAASHPNMIDFRLFLPLSAVFVIVATGCLSLDSYFGFSSGWIRYMVTFQTLQSLRENFELSWPRAVLRFPKQGDIPDDVYLGALDVVLAFTKSVNDTIRDETVAWAADFREALKGMGDSLEKQRMAALPYAGIAERGAVTVTLGGLEHVEGQKWTLDVGGQSREIIGSATGTMTGLSPGIVVVSARGRVAGRDVAIEKTAIVEPGKSADVALALGAPPPPATGVLLVVVSGADLLEDHTWTLSINGGEARPIHGASTEVVEQLPPGLVTIRAGGVRGGKPISAAGTAVVEAGKSATVSLSFG